MAGSCEGGSCEVSGVSVTEKCGESSCQVQCDCGSDCGGNPEACAEAMWKAAFFPALRSAQVEVLKEKIKRAWGPRLEKAADIILEAMGAKWQAAIAEAQAKEQVSEKLRALWQDRK